LRNTYYTEEEALLVESCKEGIQQAQFDLYQKYVQAMYNIVIRMVTYPEDAEDIIQDVFVKVFQNLEHFQGESTLGAWIKRITINTTLNFLRKEKKNRVVELNEQVNVFYDEAEVDVSTYSMAQIHHGIKQLPERSRIVLTLYLIEGYQHKEIASILKITESTSKTQYRRGKQLLQNILKN
jgi:RNA polymerase sigma-70 factor (ECF subfamily)